MCGIAGLIRHPALTPDDVAAVARMTDAQAHRGPDGRGLYHDGRVALGHRRLSIVDLSAQAAQPMANEDGSVWLTYNGEIYNHQELRRDLLAYGHRFRSQSDTEVIVHGYEQWGMAGLLERLRGMFAFGLYDARAGLFAARDRLGIKPLYYYASEADGLLVFASEVKALVRSGCAPGERDREALAGFLLTGAVPAPRTIIKDVRCLPPGHYLRWANGRLTVRQYWDLSFAEAHTGAALQPPANGSSGGPGGALRTLLQDAVSRHLMSDVPLGVFLSGGVDSGAVVALASHARSSGAPPVTTLTVTFDEREFSEAGPTRELASRFHTDHREVRVTRQAFIDALPYIVAAMDQPTHDGVNTWFVSRAAREAGLKVVLSGLGGDEVFWGYRHHRWLASRADWLGRCPAVARKALASVAQRWGQAAGRERWMRMAFVERSASARDLYLLTRGFFAPQHVQRLLGMERRDLDACIEQHFPADAPAYAGAGVRPAGLASAVNYLEFKRYLHDQLLRDADVFSMAHSIELRVPLLDHRVVEFAAAAAPAGKAPNGINKPLLVGAVDDPLLRRAAAAPKRGFSFPMERWMRESGSELEAMAASGDLLDRDAVCSLWQEFRDGRLHWSRAWSLSVLGAGAQ